MFPLNDAAFEIEIPTRFFL